MSPRRLDAGLDSVLRELLHPGFLAAKGPSAPLQVFTPSPFRETPWFVLSFLLLQVWFSTASLYGQTMTQDGFVHDGVWREYWVHLPPDNPVRDSYPLILNLHGFGSDAESQAIYTAMNEVADTAGIIQVYPQGIQGRISWLGENTHWNAYFNDEVDDLGFLDRLLDRLMEQYEVDPTRVYMTGHSNGGFMTYLMACERSDRIAAIATVAGSMHHTQFRYCVPSRSVPILMIHGTEDQAIKFGGSSHYASVAELVDFWQETYACKTSSGLVQFPNLDPTDQSTVSARFIEDCREAGAAIHVYEIENGGHTWPGTTEYFEQIGVVNQDIHASRVIWDFFRDRRHPAPSPARAFEEESEMPSPMPFRWFYNRTMDQLEVEWDHEIAHWVQILDMGGRVVQHSPYPGSRWVLDFPKLTSGIYLIRSKQQQQIFHQKISIVK